MHSGETYNLVGSTQTHITLLNRKSKMDWDCLHLSWGLGMELKFTWNLDGYEYPNLT